MGCTIALTIKKIYGSQSIFCQNSWCRSFIKMNCKLVRVFSSSKSLYPRASVISRLYSSSGDIEIHTGQKWNDDDYRMARFMDCPKVVNPNWAIKLIEETPVKAVKERVVWCDGGSGPEGHPRVYINLDKPGAQSCGYCGLRFVQCH